MQTLDEFIDAIREKNSIFPRSEWVEHCEWESMYVRAGPAYIEGIKAPFVITLANITARVPGTGAFTRLLDYLEDKYHCPIIVECVQNDRFAKALVSPRYGFVRMTGVANSYFKI